jgi:hypothetical protein
MSELYIFLKVHVLIHIYNVKKKTTKKEVHDLVEIKV